MNKFTEKELILIFSALNHSRTICHPDNKSRIDDVIEKLKIEIGYE